jgi:DNA-binding MarR family transcriptional regulator
MWFNNKPIMVSDALRYMKSIKSPFTARKYLQKAIDGKLIIERKNPADERSVLVELTPEVRKKLDSFFDKSIDRLLETSETLQGK